MEITRRIRILNLFQNSYPIINHHYLLYKIKIQYYMSIRPTILMSFIIFCLLHFTSSSLNQSFKS
ncbi:unnamed protein product [Paramecium sonneborni]|uniref:Uncharacterized protein n=1 Tax=Paramecium sonneborni TaxID=65129 RepID=A0A8S1JZM6_9CILI|nr:unnamed protein product [Paramecium sonneborni]